MPAPARLTGYRVAMLLIPLLFGSIFISGKYVANGLGPQIGAAVRYVTSVVIMLPLLFWQRGRVPVIAKTQWRELFWLGMTGMVLFNLCLLWGVKLAPASDGPILSSGTSPFITALIAQRVLGEPFTGGRKITGLFIALVGALCFFIGVGAESAGWMRWVGDLCFLGAGVAWAIYSVLNRKALQQMDTMLIVAYSQIWGAAILLLLALPEALVTDWRAITPVVWAHAIYIGIGITAFGQWLYSIGIHRLGAGAAVAYLYLVPVVGMLLAVALFGERPHPYQWLGAVLLSVGAVLVTGVSPAAARQQA